MLQCEGGKMDPGLRKGWEKGMGPGEGQGAGVGTWRAGAAGRGLLWFPSKRIG